MLKKPIKSYSSKFEGAAVSGTDIIIAAPPTRSTTHAQSCYHSSADRDLHMLARSDQPGSHTTRRCCSRVCVQAGVV